VNSEELELELELEEEEVAAVALEARSMAALPRMLLLCREVPKRTEARREESGEESMEESEGGSEGERARAGGTCSRTRRWSSSLSSSMRQTPPVSRRTCLVRSVLVTE
jgi:hypothetical protein